MSDLELVELMYRYEQLKDEYEDFLQSDFCKELNKNGYNTPDLVEYVRTYGVLWACSRNEEGGTE